MQGRFDLIKLNTGGLTDADFEYAQKQGTLMALLKDLPVVQRAHGLPNRIFDNMAGYFLQWLFQLGNCGYPYYRGTGSNQGSLGYICLLTTDSDTDSYTEEWGQYGSGTTISANTQDTANTSSAAKRFEEDQISDMEIWTHPANRQMISIRNRWLYLPTQGVSSNIRSIGIHYAENASYTSSTWTGIGRIGRVRLKDVDGNTVIMTKNNREALIVEYTFSILSI